jgi:hypothetical protein
VRPKLTTLVPFFALSLPVYLALVTLDPRDVT